MKTPADRRSAVAATLALLLAGTGRAVQPAANPTTLCDTPCKCAARISRRAELYVARYSSALNQQLENEKALAKMQLALLAGDEDLKKKLAPVVQAAATLVAECSRQLALAQEPTIKAFQTAMTAAALYRSLHALTRIGGSFKIQRNSDTNTQIGKLVTTTLGQASSVSCEEASYEAASYPEPTLAADSEEQAPPPGKLNSNLQVKCVETGSASFTDRQLGNSGSLETNLTFEQAKSTLTTDWDTQSHTKFHILSTYELDILGDNATEAHRQLQALAAEHKLDSCNKDISDYTNIAGQGDWDLFALKALLGKTEKESTTGETGIQNAAAAAAYGTGGTTFTTNVWKK
uniref:Variant surface glycoprotein 1125.5231 n=1 Tax=Trypanosoma brucei TaxID=5691 RepID=A0A1J0RC10_9TRYP|nr:variant surface glycoprotein 1125.5231 [Trypanosoma brucei]